LKIQQKNKLNRHTSKAELGSYRAQPPESQLKKGKNVFSDIMIMFKFTSSVAEPHHFYGAPAPAPSLLYCIAVQKF
jgi:hypothetical protein